MKIAKRAITTSCEIIFALINQYWTYLLNSFALLSMKYVVSFVGDENIIFPELLFYKYFRIKIEILDISRIREVFIQLILLHNVSVYICFNCFYESVLNSSCPTKTLILVILAPCQLFVWYLKPDLAITSVSVETYWAAPLFMIKQEENINSSWMELLIRKFSNIHFLALFIKSLNEI